MELMELTRGRRPSAKFRAIHVVVSLVLFSALHAAPLWAQSVSQPGYDPRQTERRIDTLDAEQQRKNSKSLPPLPGLARQAGSYDRKPSFALRTVAVVGASAIPQEAIAQTYSSYLDRRVSEADLAEITEAITELYRAAGYHLSRAIIPPQDIQGGRVTIKVIEGSIAELIINGDDTRRFGLPALLDPIRAERPSRLATLERHLLLANERAGVKVVDTALEEIGTATGNFRLTVSVKTWQVFTSWGIDNLGSSSVGPWQTYATGAFNSYLAPGDTLALDLSTIPTDPRQLAFSRLSYDAPIGTEGFRLGASALYSDVRPGDGRAQFNDRVITQNFEIRSAYVPVESLQSRLAFTVAADWSDVSEKDVFGPYYNDHIRAVSLTGDYRLNDSFGGTNYLTGTWHQGLNVLGASQLGDQLSRDGASGQFSTLDLFFTRYQSLIGPWSLKFSGAGQYASTVLLTSQQFYLGGSAFGRGYDSALISGDNGIAGSLEIRYDQDVSSRYLKGYQLYGFVDAGNVWNVGYSFSDGVTLDSVGAGVRLFFDDSIRADIGIAFPLSLRAPDNESRTVQILFSLSSSFRSCPNQTLWRCS
jgi:hemolysin activation/secretion protein